MTISGRAASPVLLECICHFFLTLHFVFSFVFPVTPCHRRPKLYRMRGGDWGERGMETGRGMLTTEYTEYTEIRYVRVFKVAWEGRAGARP